ncbi:uncharacterized protein DS421_18g633760 [Arachis hypogaea]|nr:uncharacterized protein DS421_18g633760 [Arachis hypogaea]
MEVVRAVDLSQNQRLLAKMNNFVVIDSIRRTRPEFQVKMIAGPKLTTKPSASQ